MKNIKYFYGAFITTIIGILLSIYLFPHNIFNILYIILILSILEISLSFDNAIINAKTLTKMPRFWQKIFIWLGLPIAVFGMRLLFPIFLVNLTSSFSFVEVIDLALNHPIAYQHALELSMPLICSFGGAFLLMVFLKFFLSNDEEHKWIEKIENNIVIKKIKDYDGGYIVFAIFIGLILIAYTPKEMQSSIALAFLMGIIVHETLGILTSIFDTPQLNASTVTRNGIIGFLYLEIIDASFSFDGVIGAFAISTNIIIIMIGLGIGAMFVRSLTILFVEKETLNKYIYIEHGAHYAIGILALILITKNFIHIPEWVTGTVGIALILISLFDSIRVNKINAHNE